MGSDWFTLRHTIHLRMDWPRELYSPSSKLSAEMLFNRRPRSKLDLLQPSVSAKVEIQQTRQKLNHDSVRSTVRTLSVNDPVFDRISREVLPSGCLERWCKCLVHSLTRSSCSRAALFADTLTQSDVVTVMEPWRSKRTPQTNFRMILFHRLPFLCPNHLRFLNRHQMFRYIIPLVLHTPRTDTLINIFSLVYWLLGVSVLYC